MGAKKIDDDRWIDFLNRIVLTPRIKTVARAIGVHHSTVFEKIRASISSPEEHQLTWLKTVDSFSNHLSLARKLSIVELDREALSLALSGHSQPRFDASGKPVFRTDLQVAGDALTLDDFDWYEKYGNRSRDDVYARDQDGKLIHEQITTPANGALVGKILSALIPAYKERSEVEHHHTGGVWVQGLPVPAGTAPRTDNLLLGFDAPAEQQQRPVNMLALPRPCINSEEFDRKFRRKLLREVILFRDSDNKLLPPLQDDVIVAGSSAHRTFQDARIEVNAVRAETLLDEGFQNDFLYELAPAWKPKPKPKSAPPNEAEREAVAQKVATKIAEQPGKASARRDSENLGYGKPAPGGFRASPRVLR